MSKFKNFRFDLPIMFCAIAIIGVIVALTKTIKHDLDEANRPRLHVYAICYNLQKRTDFPLIRMIHYVVHFPGHPQKRTDVYVDDCSGVEPGFLNTVNPGGSKTFYYAMEPGLINNATTSTYSMITGRMQANFDLLKMQVAEHFDMSQLDWRPDQSGNKIFSLDIKLPGDFTTALP